MKNFNKKSWEALVKCGALEKFGERNELLSNTDTVLNLARNYFRGRIDQLPGYGLDPVWATDAFPQEYYLGVCAVLARKRS